MLRAQERVDAMASFHMASLFEGMRVDFSHEVHS